VFGVSVVPGYTGVGDVSGNWGLPSRNCVSAFCGLSAGNGPLAYPSASACDFCNCAGVKNGTAMVCSSKIHVSLALRCLVSTNVAVVPVLFGVA